MKKIIPIIFFAVLLYSCQGAKDALQGKKRSDSGDEFLVEKKNPFVLPEKITVNYFASIKKCFCSH